MMDKMKGILFAGKPISGKTCYLKLSLLLIFFSVADRAIAQELKLWYDQPAKAWVEALPLGNSRLGAMIYGTPQREELQLNEETIWAGGPHNNDNPKALAALPEARNLIFEGKTREADRLVNQTFFTKIHGMPYRTAGSIIMSFPGHEAYQDYYRELDINRAVAVTRYKVKGVEYSRETFTSFADNVIIMRITAGKKAALNFELKYNNPSQHRVFVKNNTLMLEANAGGHEGVGGKIVYQAHSLVKTNDGKLAFTDSTLSVSGATVATLYISLATNFINYKTVGNDQGLKAAGYLAAAVKKDYASAIKNHTNIYAKQFNRFNLYLGKNEAAAEEPTIKRIINYKTTQDPSLVTLLAQFGRYLLISSSQPGGQPANLQGIWCNSLWAPWDSKYTININTEMNYWPAEVTNLSATHRPLIQMVKELSESGQGTAKIMYGANGWVAHHNTDLWRISGPVDFAAAGMWPTGGAWLSQHLWEHYLYTGDKKYLAEVYPALKGCADFFLSTLVRHPAKGWMVVSPSVSPEQGPLSAGTTMDNQLVFDILTHTAQASEILDKDDAYRKRLLNMVQQLAPMQIGKHAQLQEWLEDKDDPRNEHRHVSHLYGLYPGNQISPYLQPQLFEAARNSLIYRGDKATGWSIGWKVNLWARLLDGNHAYTIVNNMLTLAEDKKDEGRTYPNLFTAHPPFQIDGNFGLTAGIAEMILQSHDGAVHLLPAIPDIWKDGSVSGIVARGGYEFDVKWKNGEVAEIKVLSKLGGNLRLRSYNQLKAAGLKPAMGANTNPIYKNPAVADPLISAEASFKGAGLRNIYEYDMLTRAGNSYMIYKK